MALAGPEPGGGTVLPPPQLYRVTWSDDQVRFEGGPGDVDVHVSLVPET